MIIEIHRRELEAIIRERMESGAYESVEDVLMQALAPTSPSTRKPKPNLAQFLLESPLRDSGLKLERQRDSPRPAEL
jgi:hypothetical protein